MQKIEDLINEMLHNELTDIQEIDVTEMWRNKLIKINEEMCCWAGYSEQDPRTLTDCGKSFDYFDHYEYKYCPYCGRKMEF